MFVGSRVMPLSVVVLVVVISGYQLGVRCDGGADESSSARAGSPTKELFPQEGAQLMPRRITERDDDHWSKYGLDKLQQQAGLRLNQQLQLSPFQNEPIYMGRLLRRNNLFDFEPFGKQLDKKRNIRALQRDEDKDYSFVVALPSEQKLQEAQIMKSNRFYLPKLRASSNKWAAQKLRDQEILNSGQTANMRSAPSNELGYQDNGNYFDQLSQFNNGEVSPINTISNELLPINLVPAENRVKRRRCKMDPNLGVKNPSFCDADSYFAAADYNVPSVWDLAGRR